MPYKMKHFELDKNWGLDEWPDEVSLSHKAQPNVSRKYAPIGERFCPCGDSSASTLVDSDVFREWGDTRW